MKCAISNLEVRNILYFSEDGINFSKNNSVLLYPNKINYFVVNPDFYFLFHTDLIEGGEMVGDGEVPAKYSDWHGKVYIDREEYYVGSPLMYRKVRDHLCQKIGCSDQ